MGSLIIYLPCPHFQRGKKWPVGKRGVEGNCNNTVHSLSASVGDFFLDPSLMYVVLGLLHLIFNKNCRKQNPEHWESLSKGHFLCHGRILTVVLSKIQFRLWSFTSVVEVLRTEDGVMGNPWFSWQNSHTFVCSLENFFLYVPSIVCVMVWLSVRFIWILFFSLLFRKFIGILCQLPVSNNRNFESVKSALPI